MPNNGSRSNKDDDDGESIAMDQTSTNISDAPIVGNMANSSSDNRAQDNTTTDDIIDTTNDDDEQQLAAEDDNASSQQQPNTPTARPPSITTDCDNQQPDVTSTWSADSDGRPISIPHSWRGPTSVAGGSAHDNSIISPGGTHVISHPPQPSSSSQ